MPVPEESVNFETSENLIIEGDNLEVLKLLQKSYHGKIKMIYIDPPYNTGNEFIYPDKFREGLEDYLRYSGQVDGDGIKLSTNTETDGRFHSKWLNMMYPRLFLARNLLADDGVIFISIDEIEFAKLRLMCDEIFGEENHIADFVWQNKKGGGNDAKYVAVEHEYIVMYAKNEVSLHHLFEPYKPEYLQRYKEQDEKGKFYWDTFKRKSGKQYYPITCPDGTVLQYEEYGNPISWLRSEERFKSDVEQGEIRFIKTENGWSVQFKQRLPQGKKPRSIFLEESMLTDKGTTSSGSEQILKMFEQNIFPNPKPVELIKHLIGFTTQGDEYVMDFFAGSGTTGQAVLEMNQETGSKRKFIMVQLPEPTGDPSYPYITDIMKERIRRSLKKGQGSSEGVRVFKLSSSNFKVWDLNVNKKKRLEEHLRLFTDNIISGRTNIDLLYEVILKSGLSLAIKIEEVQKAGNIIYLVEQGALIICLESKVTRGLFESILQYRPGQVVCLDSAFEGNDNLKTNVKLQMEVHGVVFRTI
ncbi:site-specific DNA-methyltransferase [Alicyclobacillus tolerans]|uniref:site-specific DNA-methyltransferase n=1 Tax=Alicyclobacillus tolerans TaxID=90970 RepID=UPI003B7A1320